MSSPYGQSYDRSYDASYEPPSDPWQSEGEPWRDSATSSLGGGPQPPPYPGWGDEPPPPPRRSNTLLYVAVGLLVLVVAAAVGYALFLLSGEETPTGTAPGPTVAPSGSPGGASASPPLDNLGLNAALAGVGDCLVNYGTEQVPEMQIVLCEPDGEAEVFEVLARFVEAVEGESCDPAAAEPSPECLQERDVSANDICGEVEDYTNHYYELWDEGSAVPSFVLCMEAQFDQGPA